MYLSAKPRFWHVIWEWARLSDPLGFCFKQPCSSYLLCASLFSSFQNLYYRIFFEKVPETKCLVTSRRNSSASLVLWFNHSILAVFLLMDNSISNFRKNTRHRQKYLSALFTFFVISVRSLHSQSFFLYLVHCSQMYSAWRHCIWHASSINQVPSLFWSRKVL